MPGKPRQCSTRLATLTTRLATLGSTLAENDCFLQVIHQRVILKQLNRTLKLQVEPKKTLVKLRSLSYSPEVNPLMEPNQVQVKKRWVKTGRAEQLVNLSTGEISGMSAHHQIEEKDDAEFVKVFAAGVKAIYDLTRTASRVFQVVLDQYQKEPMRKGFADSLYLAWFDGGLDGQSIGMSESTFNRGLRELVEKNFLYPRSPSVYWVNPSMFFKGDRVMFIKEYRRRKTTVADALEARTSAPVE